MLTASIIIYALFGLSVASAVHFKPVPAMHLLWVPQNKHH